MIFPLVSNGNPLFPMDLAIQNSKKRPTFSLVRSIHWSRPQVPQNTIDRPSNPKAQLLKPIVLTPDEVPTINTNTKKTFDGERGGRSQQMLALCGFGYWAQGFRCGVLLQVLAWGPLALIPVACEGLPTLMVCVFLSNLRAPITEVAKDALVAEYGQKHKMRGLQSYAFMALAAGGILGNLLGGLFLLKTQQPKSMFLVFTALLALQLAISLTAKEDSLGLFPLSTQTLVKKSILAIIRKQYSDLMVAISEESISRSLNWIIASIAMVPILSGSIFCYQTQCLNLDTSIIGMSRVIGQLMLLSIAVLYDRFWKSISLRKLIGLAETIAQFRLLPFQVLFASLAPPGDYSSLPFRIVIQFLAALGPLIWIHNIPSSQPVIEKENKRGVSKIT